ncbi:MAG: hypothetical protein ABJL55_02195 [Roseibium sp.]
MTRSDVYNDKIRLPERRQQSVHEGRWGETAISASSTRSNCDPSLGDFDTPKMTSLGFLLRAESEQLQLVSFCQYNAQKINEKSSSKKRYLLRNFERVSNIKFNVVFFGCSLLKFHL